MRKTSNQEDREVLSPEGPKLPTRLWDGNIEFQGEVQEQRLDMGVLHLQELQAHVDSSRDYIINGVVGFMTLSKLFRLLNYCG